MKINFSFRFLAIILVTICICGCRCTSESQIGYLVMGKKFWNLSSADITRFKEFESKIEYVKPAPLLNKKIIFYLPKNPYATAYILDEMGNVVNSYDFADDRNFTNYRWKSGNSSESLRLKTLLHEIKGRRDSVHQPN